MTSTQAKADAASIAALGAGSIAWLDILHSFFEWGVLILGFLSGCWALYWNIRKWRREKSLLDYNRRKNDKSDR